MILALFWGGVSYCLGKRSDESAREKWLLHALTGVFGGLASLGLLTAASFIPDDWSACRLSWSAGVLCGYPLYSGDAGPSNGFFYPPVGAWFYLPAAAVGLISKSVEISLTLGWIMSLICIIFPLVLLLFRSNGSDPSKRFFLAALPCGLTGIGFAFALPQLRYLATMIHVDSPAVLFLALSVVLFLPIGDSKKKLDKRIFFSGVAFAFAAMTKQSIWPLVPVFAIGCIAFYGLKKILIFIAGGIIATFIIIICFYFLGENFYEAYKMIWYWPIRQASVTPIVDCILQTWRLNMPLMLSFGASLLIIKYNQIKIDKTILSSIYFCLILGGWSVPFSILTRAKIGADSNHLALPSYFFLMALILILNQILIFTCLEEYKRKSLLTAVLAQCMIIASLVLPLNSYIKTYCGWYLLLNKFHSQVYNYEFLKQVGNQKPKVYFPWQVFSTLIATGKLYHIDDCLRYEEAAGWKRSSESLQRFLPDEPFMIATRPFGAPSYLVGKMGFQQNVPDANLSKALPNWEFFSK